MKRLSLAIGLTVIGLCLAEASPGAASPAPSAVVRSFYQALNRGRLDEINPYYSADYWAHNLNFPSDLQEYTLLGEIGTVGHSITAIDVADEKIDGGHAWVTVTLHYRAFDPQSYRVGLVQEAGGWKITWY